MKTQSRGVAHGVSLMSVLLVIAILSVLSCLLYSSWPRTRVVQPAMHFAEPQPAPIAVMLFVPEGFNGEISVRPERQGVRISVSNKRRNELDNKAWKPLADEALRVY